MEIKKLKSLEDFKNKIRRQEPDGCDCKLCEDFLSNLGSVNFVWLCNIDLTLRIHKFALISSARKCLPCWHLPARSWHGETAGGICTGWNLYRANNDGNRAMSVMSLWCLYCWLWAYLLASSCILFFGFERVTANCLDMILLSFLIFMFLLYILHIYIYIYIFIYIFL